MKIGAPKETFAGENRVAMTPESAQHIQKLGHSCVIEAGAGEKAGFTDAAYDEDEAARQYHHTISVRDVPELRGWKIRDDGSLEIRVFHRLNKPQMPLRQASRCIFERHTETKI